MTPAEARLILKDGALKTVLEASHPDSAPADDCIEYLRDEIYPALNSLMKLVRKTAKQKRRKNAKK